MESDALIYTQTNKRWNDQKIVGQTATLNASPTTPSASPIMFLIAYLRNLQSYGQSYGIDNTVM